MSSRKALESAANSHQEERIRLRHHIDELLQETETKLQSQTRRHDEYITLQTAAHDERLRELRDDYVRLLNSGSL